MPVAGIAYVLHGGRFLLAAVDGVERKIGIARAAIGAHAKKSPLHERTFIIAGGHHEHQRICEIIQLPHAVKGGYLRIDSLLVNGVGGGLHVGNHGGDGQGISCQQQGKARNSAHRYRSHEFQDIFRPLAPHVADHLFAG